MDLSCAKVDIATYAALLRKCSDLGRGKQIHAEIVTNGLSYSTFLNNLLVQMYGRCGNPQQAKQVFDNIDERNTYSWTLMTLAYTQNGCAREAVELYKQMESQQDIQPDAFTFSGVLGAFLDPRDFEQGKKVHEDILRNGWDSDLVLATGLIGMYSRCGSLELARSVFDKMEDRDHVAWTTMVVAYVRNGHPQQCLKLFEEMKDSAVFPSVFTFTAVLVACGNLGDLQQGRKIHREMPRRCLESTEVQNALVDMYAKCGSLEEARGVFENMDNRDIVSWSSMISAYSRHEQYASKAVELYRKMDLEGVKPDGFVFSSVLSAFSSLGDLQQGRCVHDRLLACGEKLDVVIAAALVKLYASGKFLGNARCVFELILGKDVVLWANMISAYAQEGDNQEAMVLYNRMLSQGDEPDAPIYACALGACCNLAQGEQILSRMVGRGFELDEILETAVLGMYLRCSGLEAARRKFDSSVAFKRNQFAASMIIAEYVKAEQPEKALAVYRDMELRPDAITYASIVSACTALGATAEECGAQYVHQMREAGRSGAHFQGHVLEKRCFLDSSDHSIRAEWLSYQSPRPRRQGPRVLCFNEERLRSAAACGALRWYGGRFGQSRLARGSPRTCRAYALPADGGCLDNSSVFKQAALKERVHIFRHC